MDANEIAKFKRNSGQGKVVEIGADSFYFKPLPLKHLPELMELGRVIQEQGEAGFMKKENASIMFDVLKVFVTNSYPDLAKEQEVLDGFIRDNMEVIQTTLMETSVPKSSKGLSDSQREAVERLRNAQSPQPSEQ